MDYDVEKKILDVLASEEHTGRRIIMPNARRLSDIFERFEPIPDLSSYQSKILKSWIVDNTGGVAELSSFCSVHGFSPSQKNLDIVPQMATFEAIEQHVFRACDYVINFEIIINHNKTATIMARNNSLALKGANRVSGSTWFAVIPASEIPS